MFAGTLVIGIHCFTSFWLAMSQFDYENNWLANKLAVLRDNGEDIDIKTAESQIRVYFLALYFVMQTITTVGYGDVNPTNTKERIFVIFMMLVGVVSFSFIAGGLTSIITVLDDKKSEETQRDNKLMLLRDRFNIDDELYN
jgi:hypothetical protein